MIDPALSWPEVGIFKKRVKGKCLWPKVVIDAGYVDEVLPASQTVRAMVEMIAHDSP